MFSYVYSCESNQRNLWILSKISLYLIQSETVKQISAKVYTRIKCTIPQSKVTYKHRIHPRNRADCRQFTPKLIHRLNQQQITDLDALIVKRQTDLQEPSTPLCSATWTINIFQHTCIIMHVGWSDRANFD